MIAQNKENRPIEVEYTGKEPLKGKRETFAQLIASGTNNNTEAARKAGYKDNKGLRRYAHTLATNVYILARSGHLRAKTAEKFDISRESQTKIYIKAAERFEAEGDNTNYVKAMNSIDKLHGLSIDKSETSEGQKARTAVQKREAAEYAQWKLEKSLKHDKEPTVVVMEGV